MKYRCQECKKEIEVKDNKKIEEKESMFCPQCGGEDVVSLNIYNFIVYSNIGDRIVYEFEVDAVDEDEAETLAIKEIEFFTDSLYHEMQ